MDAGKEKLSGWYAGVDYQTTLDELRGKRLAQGGAVALAPAGKGPRSQLAAPGLGGHGGDVFALADASSGLMARAAKFNLPDEDEEKRNKILDKIADAALDPSKAGDRVHLAANGVALKG
jgi:hypothetical protein